MLSHYEGNNETGLTQQGAGPVREQGQAIELDYLYKGLKFDWKVTGGKDTFAFQHPSLAKWMFKNSSKVTHTPFGLVVSVANKKTKKKRTSSLGKDM